MVAPPSAAHRSFSRPRGAGAPQRPSYPQRLPYLRAAHAGVVDRRVRLEVFSARERAGDDRIEAGVADELGGDVECRTIVAGQRNPDLIAAPVRLAFERLE